MLERFAGVDGERLLLLALQAQSIVGQRPEVAAALNRVGVDLLALDPGDTLITQGAADNDLYLILSGRVAVRVNGHEVALRQAGQHVGEMALIDPTARRSATVIAVEPTIAARVSEARFSAVALEHPALWRAFATVLGQRLRERSRFIRPSNPTPVVFLGSSSESLPLAAALDRRLQAAGFLVRLWSRGVFGASRFPIEDLETQMREADFGVLIAGQDDEVSSRGKRRDAPRDNVVFELGLFMGALSRHRTFLVAPSGVDLKLPTDVLNLTQLRYPVDPTSRGERAVAQLRRLLRMRAVRLKCDPLTAAAALEAELTPLIRQIGPK